ncbi:hypothetical protein [Actinomadura sp. K4S16]|uniref:hypothetical protein n=1 Tax=Actinomadura sp. K4S16 TaxID=1316147 RepID=UPI0011EDCCE2|nr:hypothetical protein [Actinomadura sp. K4S16]
MRRFQLALGSCLLAVSVVAAVFSLSNAYTADNAVDTSEPKCGQAVQAPGQECVTSYGGGPANGGGISYEEAKKTQEDTAISRAWLFGVELLGTVGIALFAGGVVCMADAIWSRGLRLPMLLGGVLIPAAAYGAAFWPAQERVLAVSPVAPGALGFLGFPYFPIVVIAGAALATVQAWRLTGEGI